MQPEEVGEGLSLSLSNMTVIATGITTVVTAAIPLISKWTASREAARSDAAKLLREEATREMADLVRENAALRRRVAELEGEAGMPPAEIEPRTPRHNLPIPN